MACSLVKSYSGVSNPTRTVSWLMWRDKKRVSRFVHVWHPCIKRADSVRSITLLGLLIGVKDTYAAMEIAFGPIYEALSRLNSELNEQRKRWAADFAAEAKQEEARLKAERARIEEEKAERQRLKGIRRTEKAVAAAKREKVRLREKERELRVKTVQRRQKEFVMHLRRTAREEELLIDSRNWVTRETLDSRIERALKNPRELYDPRG